MVKVVLRVMKCCDALAVKSAKHGDLRSEDKFWLYHQL